MYEDFDTYGNPTKFVPDDIKAGDRVLFVEARSQRTERGSKTVKVELTGIWDGEKVEFDDKEKTTVRTINWLAKINSTNKNFMKDLDDNELGFGAYCSVCLQSVRVCNCKVIKKLEKILANVDDLVETKFVTAKFGDNWKEHAKKNYDKDTIIDIAWKQGRRSILLEKALKDLYEKYFDIDDLDKDDFEHLVD